MKVQRSKGAIDYKALSGGGALTKARDLSEA